MLLCSITVTGCLIFPYSIIVIQRKENLIEYGSWAHTLGSAGLFFSGMSYWIFASAYLKTSMILTKLLKKMKLQIFSDQNSNNIQFNQHYSAQHAHLVEQSAKSARNAIKSEKELVRETKSCITKLNIVMGLIAIVVIFLNFSGLFKNIPFYVRVTFNCMLVVFVLATCVILLYSFCNIRFLLVEFEVKQLKNDAMVCFHCISFLCFNVCLMTMLALVEANQQLLYRQKQRELSLNEQLLLQWTLFIYQVLFLIVATQALLYVQFLLWLIMRYTRKVNVEKMKELQLGWQATGMIFAQNHMQFSVAIYNKISVDHANRISDRISSRNSKRISMGLASN